MPHDTIAPSPRPRRAGEVIELFTPKLVTILREGYGARELRTDAFAGLTVAIVALPLSMAIAIASGVGPERGLYAAIIGGVFVSALGGSRFQIGGPAGAFIVLVAAAAERHGIDGLLLATFLAGLMLAAAGFLRLGSYIRLIPFPVTVGFTAGIAVIIFASQIKDLLGLTLVGHEPGPIAEKLKADAAAIGSFNAYAAMISVLTIAVIVGLKKLRPSAPSILIAVVLASLLTAIFHLPVETIGSRFGELPRGLLPPALPNFSPEKIAEVFPDAFSFFLLGAIESLLSATVADAMTGRRHRSNCELVAQGAANVASSIFGGLVVTGTIARTATNIRAGAYGPIAGVIHSLALLGFMIVAAPLAAYAPLAALAGVLATVAWNMAEKGAFASLLRSSKGDAAALLATFLLTVFRDLTEAIIAGVAIAAIAFIHRMSEMTELSSGAPMIERDEPDAPSEARTPYEAVSAGADHVAVYRLSGAVFFGSAASLGVALDRVLAGQKTLILDFSAVAIVDSSGANAIAAFVANARKRGVDVVIAGASAAIRKALFAGELKPPHVRYAADLETALEDAKSSQAQPGT